MTRETFRRTAGTLAVLVLAASVSVLAQSASLSTFSGEINSYSPVLATTPVTGPYEIRGPWTLKLNAKTNTADFSTDLNMEESDGWCMTQNGSSFDPAARNAHTHHITLAGGTVTSDYRRISSQRFRPPIMGNGSISSKLSPSVLTIEVTGGTDDKFSNITVTFASPAPRIILEPKPVAGVVREPSIRRVRYQQEKVDAGVRLFPDQLSRDPRDTSRARLESPRPFRPVPAKEGHQADPRQCDWGQTIHDRRNAGHQLPPALQLEDPSPPLLSERSPTRPG